MRSSTAKTAATCPTGSTPPTAPGAPVQLIDSDGDGSADIALEGRDGGDVTTALGPSGDGPGFDQSPVEPIAEAINNAATTFGNIPSTFGLLGEAVVDLSQRGWHVLRYTRNSIPSWLAVRYAERRDGDCHRGAGLITTCTNVERGPLWQSHTFQVGNVTLSENPVVLPVLLQPETKHADQWALFGLLGFPILYGMETLRVRFRRRNQSVLQRLRVVGGPPRRRLRPRPAMTPRLLPALAFGLIAGCFLDEAPRATSDSRIGVTATEDGGLEVLVALCPGEMVTKVELYATAPLLGRR